MSARMLISAEYKILGSAKFSINTATTTNADFGTPDDLKLNTLAGFKSLDRILVLFDATTAGTTDAISFSVQDAPDNAGSIGTPATAITDQNASALLAGGTGDRWCLVGVQTQSDRPWLRCRATRVGTTDTHVVRVLVLAVPSGL